MDTQTIIGIVVVFVVFYGIPLTFILSDPIISPKEKAIWVFAVLFVSWFAWILYFFVAPMFPRSKVYGHGYKK